MSWVNTLLDIGILSMQVNQKHKLEQLQSRQGEAAMVQAIVQALREYIFKFKQAAEEILQAESQYPLVAAGAMRILEARLLDFGIAPDMFPELSDKEYVASTIKLIRDNGARMTAALPAEEQTKISQVVDASLRLPEYNYYVENYEKVKAYDKAKKTYKSLEFLNNGCLMGFIWLGILGFVSMMGAFIGSTIGGIINQQLIATFGFLGFFAGLVLVVVARWQFGVRMMRPAEFKQAKAVVKDTESQVDFEQYRALEARLGADFAKVQAKRESAEATLSDFFGDSTFDQLLPG